MAAVAIQGVTKTFVHHDVGVQALRDVDLVVRSGEFVCLLGPSGCGKTTLLNMIAGLERPDRGRILVGGQEVTGPSPDRSVIFQDGGLFPWLSCGRNVEFGLKMRRMPRRERAERVQSTLERVGLHAVHDRYPHELSGGQRQRVAIARALVLEPEVLLCDEPFSALDVQTRGKLVADVVELWRATRMTIVWVEHNTYLAPVLADRVIVFGFNPGRPIDEVIVRLPRPRRSHDSAVVRVGDFLTARLEALHGHDEGHPIPALAPPPGTEVHTFPQPPPVPGRDRAREAGRPEAPRTRRSCGGPATPLRSTRSPDPRPPA
jgi:NitT/TauT family transport system ATP-binding protein